MSVCSEDDISHLLNASTGWRVLMRSNNSRARHAKGDTFDSAIISDSNLSVGMKPDKFFPM